MNKNVEGVYYTNNDSKRYVIPELMKLKGHEFLTIGEVHRLSIVLKSDNEDEDDMVNIDYIERYKIYREYSTSGRIDNQNTKGNSK